MERSGVALWVKSQSSTNRSVPVTTMWDVTSAEAPTTRMLRMVTLFAEIVNTSMAPEPVKAGLLRPQPRPMMAEPAMGVTVVMLPIGIPVGLGGLFVLMWGLFGWAEEKQPPTLPPGQDTDTDPTGSTGSVATDGTTSVDPDGTTTAPPVDTTTDDPGELTQIRLEPANAVLEIDLGTPGSMEYTVLGIFEDGSELDVTADVESWEITNAEVGAMNGNVLEVPGFDESYFAATLITANIGELQAQGQLTVAEQMHSHRAGATQAHLLRDVHTMLHVRRHRYRAGRRDRLWHVRGDTLF